MNKIVSILSVIIAVLLFSCSGNEMNISYNGNPAPLRQNAYIKLPLGSVRAAGWLKSQLEAQAGGLTGNLDDFWPDLVNSSWKGGRGEAWERGPYYLDGLIPLAYILDDQKLIAKVKTWIEPILASQTDSGWYGPVKNRDRWPLAVANKVLMQYYDATHDERALNVLLKYFRYLQKTPPDWPDKDWRGVRAMENAVTGYWLYRQTKEPWILDVISSIQNNSRDWTLYYEKFPWDSVALAEKKIPIEGPEGMTAHGVNNAMAIKYPGLWYQQSKDERYRNAVFAGLKKYDLNHGQVGGRFSADEHLSGKSPARGTELCTVVEYMFSMEELYEILGDNRLADRLELLAFNSLAGTTTPDMWAHQYDQQANQVLVSADKRDWSSNGIYSNIYGLMPNFACCLANMHQGWPKFTESLWMATNDNGLIAVAYSPSVVTAKVSKGIEVTVSEETNYPFDGHIKFRISSPRAVRFPLYFRVPGWADSVNITYKNKTIKGSSGSTVKLLAKWNPDDEIVMDIPMKIRVEKRYNNSLSLLRGPVYFSLRMAKEYKSIKPNYDNFGYKGSIDWEIDPRSPWNYGLLLDRNNPGMRIELAETEPGKYPFADRGDMIWSADSAKYIQWENDAPLVLTCRGILIPGWTMKDNSADVPPLSPLEPEGTPQIIQLVPYGCARLRITEFPVFDLNRMEDVIR
ncbi:MAG: beta-L-arabinofuranosidase domain-containing protein [Bacteroidales bacterium]